MITDYLILIWRGIKHRKLRNFLTVLGVVIGITAIVSLMMVTQGLENSIKDQFSKIGTNRMYVMMKSGGGFSLSKGLTDDDVKVVESLPYFKWVTPYLVQSLPVEYARKTKTLYVIGIPVDNVDSRLGSIDVGISEGRLFETSDKYSTMVGMKVGDVTYDKKITLNSNLIIKGNNFKVVGIMNEVGNPQDDSQQIYAPIDTIRKLNGPNNKDVTMIELVVKPGVNMDDAQKEVTRKLAQHRGYKLGDEDFDVQTPEQLLAQLNSILSIVQTILIAIAIISLVVGSIGIMNSMYTSILERTKDIGVMMAVGAHEKEIMTMFLLEAGLVGLFGGIIGAALGIGISKLFEMIAQYAGFSIFKVSIDWVWIIFSIIFSALIGMVSGYLPAKRAARLKPVEALK